MPKAWAVIVLLAEGNWFYASPILSCVPLGRNFRSPKPAWEGRKVAAADGADFRLIRFDRSFVRRGANGCIVRAQFVPPAVGEYILDVVCKVIDVLRHPDDILDGEACAYATP